MEAEDYKELLRPLFTGQRLVLMVELLAHATRRVELLRELGSARLLVIGLGTGTGPLPSPDDADVVELGFKGARTIMDAFRALEALAAQPSQQVTNAIDAYDPEGDARVILPAVTVAPRATMAGRKIYGARTPEWTALEDKSVIDAFWDLAGIQHAPSAVVPAESAALKTAARRLDRGDGTVWAGDARDGVHGGAQLTFPVRSDEEAEAAGAMLAARCNRARVMPFLEGIPCSIHGLVFRDGVAVFRPVEQLTLRSPSGFLYAGTATFWDPPRPDRQAMRSFARRVGEALRERISYRGAFTVDGILTADGFRPSELNTRYGTGFAPLTNGLLGLPLALINLAVIEDEDIYWSPEHLESLVVEHADAHRAARVHVVTQRAWQETERYRIVGDASGYSLARAGESGNGELILGPSLIGGMVGFAPDPPGIPTGQSIAPLVGAAFALADETFDAGIGPLHPPHSVSARCANPTV